MNGTGIPEDVKEQVMRDITEGRDHMTLSDFVKYCKKFDSRLDGRGMHFALPLVFDETYSVTVSGTTHVYKANTVEYFSVTQYPLFNDFPPPRPALVRLRGDELLRQAAPKWYLNHFNTSGCDVSFNAPSDGGPIIQLMWPIEAMPVPEAPLHF